MSVSKPGQLTVRSDSTGALVLTGELDVATIQQLQDKIDEIVVPGQPIVLDLADLTFLDTSLRPAGFPIGASSAWRSPSECCTRALTFRQDRPCQRRRSCETLRLWARCPVDLE
jgi:hypothetical protein